MPVPETPLLAADIIIRLKNQDNRIILIERKNPPYGWALPGGFVDRGECVEQAAVREAKEEVGLDVHLETLLGCYSDPGRDPRGHTVSLVYIASAEGEPVAADDARSLCLVDPGIPGRELAFDHDLILRDFLVFLDSGQIAPLRCSDSGKIPDF
jgi:8-oxo-dGTP diphosphatase